MKRLLPVALLLCALAVPPAAWALRLAPGDGTLVVREGDGNLALRLARGAVIGKIEGGTLAVAVETQADCDTLDVFGADRSLVREQTIQDEATPVCVFREFLRGGTRAPIRFRFERGRLHISIFQGRGVSLGAVGRGTVFLRGVGGMDGVYSLDGADFSSLPDDGRRHFLGTLNP